MRYFIELSYDGTDYHGWQRQDGSKSIQAAIEQGLYYKINQNEGVTGCGRTDAGVHARQFFAHFDLFQHLDKRKLAELRDELNSFLPQDIAIHRIFRVRDQAHTRFDAIARTYKYYISTNRYPFNRHFSWYYHAPLNVEEMNRSAEILGRYSDFTSFAKLHGGAHTNICQISHARWEKLEHELVFTITADRFLRNMVRSIVGTMVDIGRGKIDQEELSRIIESMDRSRAGMSAPAKGLFLEKIDYNWEEILKI
ncbi:MAG: tRNA pseudouridine(38-40) synthase TruA [Bacteroidales bacterium]